MQLDTGPRRPRLGSRGFLRLSAIRTWQPFSDGQPTPDLDPAALERAIYEVFVTSQGCNQVDRLYRGCLQLARQANIAVETRR